MCDSLHEIKHITRKHREKKSKKKIVTDTKYTTKRMKLL